MSSRSSRAGPRRGTTSRGGRSRPHTGDQYVYSQIADVSYKRLTREIQVPAAGGDLNFWTSYDTEPAWDHVFVEARTAGGTDWTTLPDQNNHTTQDTGDSCPEGWRELHPHLDHYQTLNANGTCSPTGTGGGEWHAASGNSSGWQEWSVDLSEWSGETVEISIAYASDWATQNLGVFVDDVTLPDGTTTSFETDLGGWQITGPPAGSGPNANNWIRTDAVRLPCGVFHHNAELAASSDSAWRVSLAQTTELPSWAALLDHLLD